MFVLGIAIVVLSFGIGQVFEQYSILVTAIGVPIGAFIAFKGREKIGLKNKYFGDE